MNQISLEEEIEQKESIGKYSYKFPDGGYFAYLKLFYLIFVDHSLIFYFLLLINLFLFLIYHFQLYIFVILYLIQILYLKIEYLNLVKNLDN